MQLYCLMVSRVWRASDDGNQLLTHACNGQQKLQIHWVCPKAPEIGQFLFLRFLNRYFMFLHYVPTIHIVDLMLRSISTLGSTYYY